MQKSESLTIQWWALSRVRPYPNNPRVITEAAVQKVAASIREFGWRQPLVVDDEGLILVGHTRAKAAEKLGLSEVPVHVALGLTEAQKQAYRLADNRTGAESRWDMAKLNIELKEIGSLGFDLPITGFDPLELPTVIPDFKPVETSEVLRLDKMIEVDCPKCGHHFERRAR